MSVIGRSKLDNPPLSTPGGTALYNAVEAMYLKISNNAPGRYQTFTAVANNTVIPLDHNLGVPLNQLVVHIFTGTFPNFIPVNDPALATPAWGIAADGTNPNTILNVTTPISGGPWTGMIWVTQTALSDRETTAKLLTRFSAAAGTVSATDSILQAINKIVGNAAAGGGTNNPVFTGKVGVPSGTVAVPGLVFSADDDGTGTGIYRPAANALGFSANGIDVGGYAATGLWVIGNTGQTGTHAVRGALSATHDITAFSDRRLKDNIKAIDGALKTIVALRGVSYNRRDDGQKRIGLIAQEVLEIVPECVAIDQQTEFLSVNYQNLVGLLIEGIKELAGEVHALRNRLAEV